MITVQRIVATLAMLVLITGSALLPVEAVIGLGLASVIALALLNVPLIYRGVVFPIVALLALSTITLVGMADVSGWVIFRDWGHLAKIPVFMLGGALAYRAVHSEKKFLQIFLWASTLLTLPVLASQLLNIDLLANSIYHYKKAIIMPNLAIPLAAGILLVPRTRQRYSNRLMLVLIGTALALSLSRTYYLIALVVFLIMAGWIYRPRAFSALAVGTIAIVMFSNAVGSAGGTELKPDATIVEKIAFSAEEFWPREYKDGKVIRQHWRGYENWRSLNMLQLADPTTRLVGWGAGQQIDLKTEVTLHGKKRTSVSYLHNGLATVLIKAGLVGAASYIAILIYCYSQGLRLVRDRHSGVKDIGLMIIATTFAAGIGTLFIMLPFNAADSVPLWVLLGFALAASRGNLDSRRVWIRSPKTQE